MSFEIELGDLYVPGPPGSNTRLGLETLPSDGREHIHGRLEIRVNGRAMPALGYFGPDDVCLGQWAHELLLVLRTLSAGNEARHVYDEGEQGQPVFEFRRDESRAYISITDSDWRAVACDAGAMLSSVRSFLDELRGRLESLAPHAATAWWARNIERSSGARRSAW